MSNRDENPERAGERAFTSCIALLSAALACAVVLIAVPRPVPLTLPTLALPAAEARAALALDRELSSRAPDGPAAHDMYRVLLAVGEQELGHSLPEGPWQERVAAVARRALAELGSGGVRALRARATDRFVRALRGELDDQAEVRGLTGAQRELLVTHGYLAPDGRFLAPELSLRATYKARWNMIFQLGPAFDLSRVERLAYEGFRGLEARYMPAEQRGLALSEFAHAGGRRGAQALAIWSALLGRPGALIEQGQPAGFLSLELRVRNMALTALAAQRAAREE